MSADLESIEKLRNESSPASAEKLQELERTTNQRDIRKAARKALYLLSLIGIRPQKPPVVGLLSEQASVDNVRAFASAFDGAGNRLLIFLVPDPDGGSANLIQIRTNDMEGANNCETLKIQRRELSDRIDRMKAQVETGLAIAEIEPDYGRWLLASARTLTASHSKRSPSVLLAWMSKIGEPIHAYTAPIYTHVDQAAIVNDDSIPTDPAELLKLIWFEPWYFAAEDTMPWLQQWEQLISDAGDDLDTDPGTPIYEIVTDAATGLMTAAMRALYVIRLEESADVLWRCGKETEAKQAVYHAVTLKGDGVTAANPFAREIAFRTLGAAFEMVRLYRERRAGA